jgi:hypothetical protein
VLDGLGAHARNEGELIALMLSDELRALMNRCGERTNGSLYERDITVLRAQMNEMALAAAWAEGRAMSMDEAVACALGETEP